MSPLVTAGEAIGNAAVWLQLITQYVANLALALAIILLLIRFLSTRFDLNPFGRVIYYVRRITDRWFYAIKSSQLYQSTRQAVRFDPVWVLLLIAFVMLFFLLRSLVDNVIGLLVCIGVTLTRFGLGNLLSGVQALLGTVLLGLIYFLMGLMTILVINSWFGLFDRWSYWAGRRIYPLLRSMDPKGKLGPWAFLLAFFLLSIVAAAVQRAFF
ncbi:MAG: hypothetical protein M3X11_13265 [Acidobacteriota bacterium]|nr:hypothetical protein [Acidobacteriota bacterium]